MSSFPDHNIDPRKKGKKWCLDFIKAAYNSYDNNVGGRMFYRKARDYDMYRAYALGRQETNQYRKRMNVDEETNTTYANIDFKVFPIIRKQRQTALGRLQKTAYNIVATTIDTQAKNEIDEYYAKVKAVLAMRKAVEEQMPELLNHPSLMLDAKDPQELDELEMQAEFGFKHQAAVEAEDAVLLSFAWNDIERVREAWYENLFDHGVAVTKDWTDKNGKPKFKVCDNRAIITNYCNYGDFRDLWYCGEIEELTFHDFVEQSEGQFTEKEYEEIYNASVLKGSGNPRVAYGETGFDKHKVTVLDMQWYSIDTMVFEKRIDSRGNLIYRQVEYDQNKRYNSRKYDIKKLPMVYKGKWIMNTEYAYDCGPKEYTKRIGDPKTGKPCLDYHIEAINFHNMQAKGIMEDLIPIADQIQIAWLKWQNIQNTLMPYIIEIDLDALEDVALGKGGEVMSAKEVLDLLFQSGILITRRHDISQQNINYNAINFIQTNYGQQIAEAWNNLLRVISMVNEVIGLNALTDASTPDPKILTNPALLANEGTNNALHNIVSAEKKMLLKVANAMVRRMIMAIKKGEIKGYLPALGRDTIRFVQISPDFSNHEYGIILEDKPSEEKRTLLVQEILRSRAEGLIDVTDAIIVENEPNLKRAEKMLAYRINKRREQKQKEAMQMQQMNAQVQMQSAQAAEEAKQKTLQVEYALKAELLKMEIEGKLLIKQLEVEGKLGVADVEQGTKERIKNREMGYAAEPLTEDDFAPAVEDVELENSEMEMDT